MRVPVSTYRLQLNAGFGFGAARALVPYLAALGVSDVYASPLFAARPGSTHGYDVVDPTRLNPELGTYQEFDDLCGDLRERGMGLLLDIVPNHMAASADNPWWWDAMANGRSAAGARFFDIDWEAPGCDGRLILPFLGAPLDDVLQQGELVAEVDPKRGAVVRYYRERFPLTGVDPRDVDRLNGDGAALRAALDAQHYRLVGWREPLRNYRRFFDVSDLAAVRAEEPEVFAATHRLALELVRQGKVTGLRIDHVDGLRDPQAYLERLQQALGGDGYVVVEKILHEGEVLPAAWPVAGTTGYEFLDVVGGLFVDPFGADALGELYADFVGVELNFEFLVQTYKLRAIENLFGAELRSLQASLAELAARDPQGRAVPASELHLALVDVTLALPVYRTYVRESGLSDEDRRWIEVAAGRARGATPIAERPALAFLHRVLTLERPTDRDAWLDFVLRWQQLTGPVTAKGVEDTALYVYNRLLSRNEVGSDPASYTVSPELFHRFGAQRLEHQRHALNATSTHDTKRSEDVRARISVLSELPEDWANALLRWSEVNAGLRREVDGRAVPDRNEELLLYQILIGALPLRADELEHFCARVQEYAVKAAREAKVWTSWLAPDAAYEEALTAFVGDVLDEGNAAFQESFQPFQQQVARLGAIGSLAQVVLKLASPGVPDLYQGTESWSLRLVDPDNRVPVDFERRARSVEELQARWEDRAALAAELLDEWRDGRIKILVTHAGLVARGRRPALFADGDYLPLAVEGALAEHVCAFARRQGEEWAIALAPRLVALLAEGAPPLGDVWGDTALVLPEDAPVSFEDAITGVRVAAAGGRIALADALRGFPAALLEA